MDSPSNAGRVPDTNTKDSTTQERPTRSRRSTSERTRRPSSAEAEHPARSRRSADILGKNGKRQGALLQGFGNHVLVRSIRGGLISLIPLLLVGALALVIRSFFGSAAPALSFTSAASIVYNLVSFIYYATFGMLSVYATLTISHAYISERELGSEYSIGAMLTSLACFAILSGVLTGDFTFESFGTKGMFIALICGLVAPWLYTRIAKALRTKVHLSSDGSDVAFMQALRSFAPMLIILLACAIFEFVIVAIFGTGNLYTLFISVTNGLFEHMGRTVWSGLFFVAVSSFLWFFGIHGSDIFEGAVTLQFTPAIDINQATIAAGLPPTEILTKTFFDSFVLMGGCGSAWCLIAALIIFSRRRGVRLISRVAAVPMVFNVNEIVIFGLPVVFNPWLFIPFISVPIVNYLISYACMAVGLIPLTTSALEWTTPIFFSGWLSTGSPAGALLQLALLALGTLVYAPFVKRYNSFLENEERGRLDQLVKRLQQAERAVVPVTLTTLDGNLGAMARVLSDDLRIALSNKELFLAFQPQFDAQHRCIGAEALLRWNHPRLEYIYPPLIIKLANENGFLLELEEYVLVRSCKAQHAVREQTGQRLKISANVCGSSLEDSAYEALLNTLIQEHGIRCGDLCLEITEQMAFEVDGHIEAIIDRLKTQGISFAVDDFSMGHTSLKYLQSGQFDWVKLDGALVKGLPDDENACSIIGSVSHLANTMGFKIIAEFVETEEQRVALEEIGCLFYQGHLFSPAIPLQDYCALIGRQGTEDCAATRQAADPAQAPS